ncbi:F-box/FBD/LRR-repeat protein At1g13570-like isoform X2 [Rutidosis leptorrhynchoides]
MVPESKYAREDIINTMPSNVVSCILDFLPLQDAVRTSILSRNWRYKWTKMNQLVFNKDFFECIVRKKGDIDHGKIITRLLVHHEGSITKFVLYVPSDYKRFDQQDLSLWVKLLSRKSVKEMIVINKKPAPIILPTNIFSCVDLKRLILHCCCLPRNASIRGFPNLLSLDLDWVSCWEVLSLCPQLEVLKIYDPVCMTKMKQAEITKLKNLKELIFSLGMPYHDVAITSSHIFQLVGFLPKLHKLTLDLQHCKFSVDDAARNGALSVLHSLKFLEVLDLDYHNRAMVVFLFDLIQGSPNLKILKIKAVDKDRVWPSPVTYDEVKGGITGNLQQLRNVELELTKDSQVELSLIKCLLANCSLLQLMSISTPLYGTNGYFEFSAKLLMFSRASPEAKISIC